MVRRQRQGHRGTIALGDIANALINGGFKAIERLLGGTLAVYADDFELDTGRIVGAIEAIRNELPVLQLVLANVAEGPRQAFDHGDLHCFAFLGKSDGCACQ